MKTSRLERKAVKACFRKVGEATWDYLFDYEKENGLQGCRDRRSTRPTYRVPALKAWLVLKGYYTPEDFKPAATIQSSWAGLSVRTHALAE